MSASRSTKLKRFIKGNTPLFLRRHLNKNKPPIKLYWWRYEYPEKLNFGDEITPIIIKTLFGRDSVWSSIDECELAGAGSIIQKLQTKREHNRVDIWGSGFIKPGEKNTNRDFYFFAVRGPQSLARVSSEGKIALGDPGLLANRVFKKSKNKKYKVGVVVHYVDMDNSSLEKIRNNPDYLIISPLQSPAKVAKDITSCEYVVSSSLHGLIFADSFNIPNNWMPLSDGLTGGDYKFNDYYESTNRPTLFVTPDILGNKTEIEARKQRYVGVKNLKTLQRGLIKSFPY